MMDLLKTMIKESFEYGWTDKNDLADYVKSGTLTPKEYESIVGEVYVG